MSSPHRLPRGLQGRLTLGPAFLCLAFLCPLVGCGGTPADGAGTGSTDSGGATTGGTGAGGSDTVGSGGTDGAPVGTVLVRRPLALAVSDGTVEAAFHAAGALDPLESCTRAEYGDCELVTCPTASTPERMQADAGFVLVTTDTGSFAATGAPSELSGDYVFSYSGELIGEEVLTIEATGGEWNAFEATVRMPAPPLLTSYETGLGGDSVVVIDTPRTSDLEVTWDAQGSGHYVDTAVTLPFGITESPPRLYCRFDAVGGAGTLPSAALSQLPVGTAIHLFSTAETRVSTADGLVLLVGSFELLTEDRTGFPKFVLE